MPTDCERISAMLKGAEALPFLFIGSGISRRYVESESWDGLLRIFAAKADSSDLFYERLRDRARAELSSAGDSPDKLSILYPKIADLIESVFNETWYKSQEYQEHRREFAESVRDGLSPFKLELALYCKGLMQKRIRLENEIESLKGLSAKSIAGIITTNYDCLIEHLFPDMVPYVGQEELIFSNHFSIGEIYKIHGCCSKPNSIIINSHDYQRFSSKNAYLAAKLLTIFIEHPIIFLGYSLNDENIRNILESIVSCLTPDQMFKLQNRLIFVEWDATKETLESSSYSINFGTNKTLHMTRVSLNNYSELYSLLYNIKAKYPTKVLRQIKNDIYKLTLTTDPNSKLVALNLASNEQTNEFEYVFGIGALEIGRTGFKSVPVERLYRDVVFANDPELIAKFVIEDTLPLHMSVCGRFNIPVYKYISQYDFPLPERYNIYETRTFDDLLTGTLRNTRNKRRFHSIKDIENNDSLSMTAKLNGMAALPQNEIDVEDLHNFLIRTFELNPDILADAKLKSPMKKLIRAYDFIRYKK